MIIDGLRYITDDINQLEKMTLNEYKLRLKVYRLKQLDQMYQHLELKIAERAVKATKKSGEYKYQKVEDIIDMKKSENEILGKTEKVMQRLKYLALKLKERRENE